MSESAQKCDNNATPKLFIVFKMAYYCCFRFSSFPPKKFFNNYCRSLKGK